MWTSLLTLKLPVERGPVPAEYVILNLLTLVYVSVGVWALSDHRVDLVVGLHVVQDCHKARLFEAWVLKQLRALLRGAP